MTKNVKRVVIVMGPPGSGKGTQASLLSDKLNLYYLETSKVLEARIMNARKGEFTVVGGKKYFLSDEKKRWQTGLLNSDPFTNFLMREKISEFFAKGESLLLAGSPRSVDQAKDLLPFLKKLYGAKNIKVILLEVSAKESIFRNSHRKICELMRHPILYSKETLKLKRCPLDGSKLLKRKKLDDPKTIRARLEVYKNTTLPMVGYFKKQGISVKRINGSPAPAIVFKNILKVLGEKA
ncbi:MAG: nucleoside monophosphate kinase [bacterium]|nr:nucleoside monophosphate kinase [bacterium]